MDQPQMMPEQPTQDAPQDMVLRDRPEPAEPRRAKVEQWIKRVQRAREHWNREVFPTMVKDMRFAAGQQWDASSLSPADVRNEAVEDRYIANVTLRHIHQRTASIYGQDPKVVARRRPRLMSTAWDGTSQSLATALETAASGQPNPQALAVLADAQQTIQHQQEMNRFGETLEMLMEHELQEQPQRVKKQMKMTVRRALTTGVGYVKLGYERVMEHPKDIDARIETTKTQLAALERLSADQADGEFEENDAQAEQLRLLLQTLSETRQVVVREGLSLTYPHSTAIIPDPDVQSLHGFVGAGFVAEEFMLSADRIQEIYKVDVARVASATPGEEGMRPRMYHRTQQHQFQAHEEGEGDLASSYFCVWEIYCREDGLVYTVCEGYPEFLLEPSAPDIYLERFYPWFAFLVNECYEDHRVFPPSDVQLIKHMQMEINRARQGLREHRVASHPRIVARQGMLSEEDKDALANPLPHQLIELDGLPPEMELQRALQVFRGAPIDPALYETASVMEDYYRSVGQHEANLGGVSGGTATEAAIAEGARDTNTSSIVDDLDEFLSEIMEAAGGVLMAQTPKEKVFQVVGRGAVWPDLDPDTIAKEIFLDIEAGSTGRPNQQAEIQNAQAIMPLLMQIPGISPEWVAKELIKRLDDRLDIKEALGAGLSSIQMMNAAGPQAGPQPGASQIAPGAQRDPNAQGPQGAQNAPSTQPAQVNAAPRPPAIGPNV